MYPMVQYELYSADGDDIREKLDQGSIDIGILLEPIEAAKYDFFRLPFKEVCLLRRTIVQSEIAYWLGVEIDRLKIFASHNLLTNASLLVERGLCYAICVRGAYTIRENAGTCFVPFSPERTTGHVLAWKKNRIFTTATSLFIQAIKDTF